MNKSVFRSAISGKDGEVDSGYLALFWSMVVTVSMIPAIVVVALYVALKFPEQSAQIFQNVGVGCAALAGAFSTIIGAVGLFRMGDKDRQPATVNQQVNMGPVQSIAP